MTGDIPAARALTVVEIVKVLGGVIGGLCDFCELDTVRAGVCWLADNDEFWQGVAIGVERQKELARDILSNVRRQS